MSRRRKDGFNSPFASLKLKAPPAPQAPPKAVLPAPKPHDDAEAFTRAMAGVHKLGEREVRVEPKKREESDALALLELQELVSDGASLQLTFDEEHPAGHAPGVARSLLLALARGEYAARRSLDLHGRRRDDAHRAVIDFIARARGEGERCVLIITGRGKSSPDGVAVLREFLPAWLARAPLSSLVLAFCTARPEDGGPGAFYVLLRRVKGQRA